MRLGFLCSLCALLAAGAQAAPIQRQIVDDLTPVLVQQLQQSNISECDPAHVGIPNDSSTSNPLRVTNCCCCSCWQVCCLCCQGSSPTAA